MNCNVMFRVFQACMLLVVLFCPARLAMADDMPSEQSVRAAMVFNFLKFAKFSPERLAKASGIRLCVAVRDERQANALAALSGRKVGGRDLTVIEFSWQSDQCHVLYVDTHQLWNKVADHLALQHALTISAYPGFVRAGGMIEIAMLNDSIRFDINLPASRRAGIHFSPQMLRLARQIHE